MNRQLVIAGLVLVLAYPAAADAATLIESVDTDGAVMKTWFEGNRMRMDSGEGYALMDWQAGKMYFVNVEEGMAMDMSYIFSMQDGDGASGDVDAVVEKVGGGPEIAGYETVHYRISVDGEQCQDIYASPAALRDIGAKDLMERIQKFANSDMEEMDTEWGSPCDHADQAVDFTELGLPMRTVYVESGEVDEVRKIELDAGMPDGGFEVPAGMEIMDMSQMMQMMQGMPMDD